MKKVIIYKKAKLLPKNYIFVLLFFFLGKEGAKIIIQKETFVKKKKT